MFSSNKGTYFFYLKVSKSNTFQEKKCDLSICFWFLKIFWLQMTSFILKNISIKYLYKIYKETGKRMELSPSRRFIIWWNICNILPF